MTHAEHALNCLNYQSLILSSGQSETYFEDDYDAPFKTNPHFASWCPALGPHHLLKFEPGKKPLLIYYSPDDYWHAHKKLNASFWTSSFEVIKAKSLEKAWKSLGDLRFSVFLGNDTTYAKVHNIQINCQLMTFRLNWFRRFKSQYEILCLSEANRLAATGHIAARKAFLNGASEYEIHMAYLQALECIDTDLPYTGIVALDKNSATLHYHGKETKKNGSVLLIDSGATFQNYCADVTRTYTQKNCHPIFVSLKKEVEQMQQDLCASVKPGLNFAHLHEECHLKIAEILKNLGIFKIQNKLEKCAQHEITKVFMPHGLGHMLGVQVHDIGGKQLDEQGNPAPPLDTSQKKSNLYGSLRFIGILQPKMVVTIEPGIYFIPLLLNKFKKTSPHAKEINWNLIEELIPYGGIRVEDDVLTTEKSNKNLTREFLP